MQIVRQTARILLLSMLFSLAALVTCPPAARSQNILHFPDTNLERAVRDELGLSAGEITRNDMRRLVSLEAGRRNIADLSGLEHAVRLETLNLHQNRVRDISALAGLSNMKALYLGENQIADPTPLEKMNRLEILHLEHNPLRNINALQKLRRLRELHLEGTPLKNLQGLEGLNRLEALFLDGITADLTFLNKMTRLGQLSLVGCAQAELSFLGKLSSLTRLDLADNHLEDISALTGLKGLQWLSLENNEISDLSSLSAMARLTTINLRGNKLDDIAPLLQIKAAGRIDLRDNYLFLLEGEPAARVVSTLENKGIDVLYEPQRLPFYQGSSTVEAAPGSRGRLLRTPPEKCFTVMNPGLGWRIKSITVSCEEGKPLDFIAEIGRRDSRGRFSWNSLSWANPVSVEKKLPHTFSFVNAVDISLGMGVQIWPGYAEDTERLFYFSQVLLENIITGDTYTVELEPHDTGNCGGAEHLLRQDSGRPREIDGLSELRQTIAAALQAREPALSLTASLPRGIDLDRELEQIIEDIYSSDDYLRYSMRRRVTEWSRQGEYTAIDFRFQYHATREEEEIVDARVSGILGNIITPSMNDHQKTLAIHDFVVANVAYDQSLRAHSAYDALVGGKAVCQGYALLVHKMLGAAGIEARIISGQAGGESHAWNMVRLGGNWYHLDATWDDTVPDVPGRVLHDYYNRTDAQMRPTHTWNEGEYPAAATPYNTI